MLESIGTVGWIAITVCILLLAIWILHTSYKTGYMPDGVFRDTYESMVISAYQQYDKYLESPENLYSRTVGYENDESVELAISKAERLENTHETNERDGKLNNTAGSAAVNAFILGDLYRFNIAPNQETLNDQNTALERAAKYYNRALTRISNNPTTVVNQNTLNEPAVEQMIDRINDFYATAYLGDHAFDLQDTHDMQLENRMQTVIHNVREARVNQARQNTKIPTKVKNKKPKRGTAKQIQIDTYFDTRDVRNDPQNVHDTEVTHELRNRFKQIVEKNLADGLMAGSGNYKNPSIVEIRDDLLKSNIADKANALEVFDKVSNNTETVTSIGSSEKQILLEVWKRINSSDNSSNRDQLKTSLFNSLASGMEPNYAGFSSMVCTGGRCSRMIDSLTLLDSDTSIAAPAKTVEILRNEVFSKAHTILQQELLKVNPEVAAIYKGERSEESAADELKNQLELFKVNTKKQIETTILQDYNNSKPETLTSIIRDAQAGVDI